MIVTSALHIYFQTLPEHGSKNLRGALSGTGVGSAVVFVVCVVVVWPVGTLLGYHIRVRVGFYICLMRTCLILFLGKVAGAEYHDH